MHDHPFRVRVSDLWSRLDAIVQRTSPDDDRRQAGALFNELSEVYASVVRDVQDLHYGRGHREGRELGLREGWDQRDAEARQQLGAKDAQIQALGATTDTTAPEAPAVDESLARLEQTLPPARKFH